MRPYRVRVMTMLKLYPIRYEIKKIIFIVNKLIKLRFSFEVSSASDEGIYTLLVKTGDIGFIIPHIVNITASYLCMKKPEVGVFHFHHRI